MNAKEKIKTPFLQRTSFFVSAFVILVGLLMVVQVLPKITEYIFGVPLNVNIKMPLDVMATAMIAVCAGYCGLDRAAFVSYSAKMEYGVSNSGNPAALRNVIYWTSIVFIEAVALTLFYDVSLPLQTIGVALGSEIAIYATGNKAITLAGSIDGKVTNPVAADSFTQDELKDLEIAGTTMKDLEEEKDDDIENPKV